MSFKERKNIIGEAEPLLKALCNYFAVEGKPEGADAPSGNLIPPSLIKGRGSGG